MSNSHSWKLALQASGKPHFIKKNYVAEKSASGKYIKYRVLRPLLKGYHRMLMAKYPRLVPWLSPGAIEIFNTLLSEEMSGLEFGSGRSTIFLAKRIRHLVSVEHDEEWYKNVGDLIKAYEINNVEYLFEAPKRIETEPEIKRRYLSSYDHENENYREYFEAVESFPDEVFDLILIDGRARVECATRTIGKLKKGGIFVLDNAERKRYTPIHELLENWKKVNTTTGLTDTTFWFKPTT